jgi:hypothetical protein
MSVGKDFSSADKGRKFAKGGDMKPVDMKKNPGVAKLPTTVRNKMGFMKKGGMAEGGKSDMAGNVFNSAKLASNKVNRAIFETQTSCPRRCVASRRSPTRRRGDEAPAAPPSSPLALGCGQWTIGL